MRKPQTFVDDTRTPFGDDRHAEVVEREALQRVRGISTELTDVTEVEYRQLRLEQVVLVGVWTSGTQADAERSMTLFAREVMPHFMN